MHRQAKSNHQKSGNYRFKFQKVIHTDTANFAVLQSMAFHVGITQTTPKTIVDLELAAVPSKSVAIVLGMPTAAMTKASIKSQHYWNLTNRVIDSLVLRSTHQLTMTSISTKIYRSAKGYLPWILYIAHWKFFPVTPTTVE